MTGPTVTGESGAGQSASAPEAAAHADMVTAAVAAVGVVNVANALTVVRIALVPVFAALLAQGASGPTAWRLWAFAAFAVAAVTDRLDGEVARRRDLVTDFGKVADPIADKALIGTALIELTLLGEVAWWVTTFILIREIGITALRFGVIRHGVIAASRGGKLKTLLQTIGVGLAILPLGGAWHTAVWWLLLVALVVTLVTGLDYIAQAMRLRRAAPATSARPHVPPPAGPLAPRATPSAPAATPPGAGAPAPAPMPGADV